MKPPVTELLSYLARHSRILLLGGLAVIAHGLQRATKGADAWLEPFEDPASWSARVRDLLTQFPGCSLQRLGMMGETIPISRLAEVILSDRVVRILGADRPLDLFREPHMLACEDFDAVWAVSEPLDHGIRLPDEVDLLLTKEDTGRNQDLADISFLQHKAEQKFVAVVGSSTYEETVAVFDRFLTRAVAEAALENPSPEVVALALRHLQELADAGDPYAQDVLNARSSSES